MKKVISAVWVLAFAAFFPSLAMAQGCNPACSSGSSCCVMQYSNGTYGKPYCKQGSCYTSLSKKSLTGVKELDVSDALKSMGKAANADTNVKANAAMDQGCNPACSSGSSCCVMQYSNGTYGNPYCKQGSCYTSLSKKSLTGVKELDVSDALKSMGKAANADAPK
jgi:hypothetical protein